MSRKPVTELIKTRVSWRSYTRERLSPPLREKVNSLLSPPRKGPFGNLVRFLFLEKEQVRELEKIKLGTYGVIKGAHSFIVGAVTKHAFCFEDYGYLFEQVILALTEYGLGTCWMGGTFNRGGFARAAGLGEREIIPAVTPAGYLPKHRSFRDRALRLGAGSKHRKSWRELFFLGNFSRPLPEAAAGRYALPLEMVRLGPSASNRQPWRIVKEPDRDSFHFVLERTRGYLRSYQGVDFQKIDMGIAMCHFELSARESGLDGSWEIRNPGLALGEGREYTVSWTPR